MNPGRLELIHTCGLKSDTPGPAKEPSVHLHVNHKLGVSVGEASKFVLVQVHDEEFVSWCEFHRLSGELFVEVGGISPVSLPNGKQTH